jgi:TolB-like protein/DNA-binding winged helix-turn-helix (wHTH) protein
MSATTQPEERIRFGDFDLNLRTRELQKNGDTFDLQEQPFLVLTTLLERSGELVTRGQLIKKLWPSDTFVDFEHSLNKAVKRLREALEDSAEEPRFIETLPRRGYRFIGTAMRVANPPANPVNGTASPAAAVVPEPRWRLGWRMSLTLGLAVVAIAAAALFWVSARRVHFRGSPALEGPIRSLAVLPLENLSGGATQDYFADGMTDELITDLGQISALRVISRTSVMQYKGARKPMPQIARELNVDAVVEGTVVRSGERVRITAQLIHAPTDRHLWAQDYEGDLRDVLGLQNQVARSVAEQIRVKLTPEQKSMLSNVRAVKPEAHDAYLRGFYAKQTADGLHERIEYFQRAIELDPGYALAYVGVAKTYIQLGHMVALPPQEAFPAAKIAALKAVELDDTLADAHEALASIEFLHDWDFVRSEKEFRRAIELNPNSVTTHAGYVDFLTAMGRADEAISEERKNLEIDPLSLRAITRLAGTLYWSRHYDESIELERKVLAIEPNLFDGHLWLGLSLEQKREFPAAIAELEQSVKLWNDNSWIGFVAHARAVSGDKAGAYRILEDMERRSKETYVSPYWPAIVCSGLGENDKAFYWLEKAYQGREHDLVFSRVWPMFDSLRSDPRYRTLMRRVGLPE